MAGDRGVRGRTVFLAVLVALLLGALFVLWAVVKLAARILAVVLVAGLVVIGLISFGLRRMFSD